MTGSPSQERIAAAVGKALEETLQQESFPDRLWPYTAAQLAFLREFVSRAIAGALSEGQES